MSDEQSPDVGSRRRRREIREARERERAQQRERDSAVRRLSTSSTAEDVPAPRPADGADGPALFDQEKSTPKDQRRSRRSKTSGTSRHRQSAQEHSEAPQTQGDDTRGGDGPAPAAQQNRNGRPSSGSEYPSRRERRRQQTEQLRTVQEEPAQNPASQGQPGEAHPGEADRPSTSLPQSQQPASSFPAAPEANSPAPATARSAPAEHATSAPQPAPAASSSFTTFDDVVAPRSAASPAANSPDTGQEQFFDENYVSEDYELHEDFEHLDWDEEYDGAIAHDEDGTPVLVGASGYGRGYQTVAPVEGGMNRTILKQRRIKRRRRNITLTVALLGFAALMGGFVMILQSLLGGDSDYDYEAQAGDTVEFEVFQGDGFSSVQQRLVNEEIVASSEAFQEAMANLGEEPILHPGTFEMREEMPAEDAVSALFAEADQQGYIALADGWRIDQILEAIASAPGIDIELETLQELNENPQQFGLPEEAEDLEGFIASGEYQPSADATAEEILQSMVDSTFERLEAEGVTDPDEQWRTIIIASLITAEGLPQDYDAIAGAIENRLQDEDGETSGFLQIDAAVNYGRGVHGVHFGDEVRQDASNPYNTYQHPGLTPGPIGAPHPEAVTAAADPDDNDYLFWVTVNLETGETRFAPTYDEHLDNVDEFNRWCEEDDEHGLCGQETPGGQADTDEAVEPEDAGG